jgi:hypothetical protein
VIQLSPALRCTIRAAVLRGKSAQLVMLVIHDEHRSAIDEPSTEPPRRGNGPPTECRRKCRPSSGAVASKSDRGIHSTPCISTGVCRRRRSGLGKAVTDSGLASKNI